MIQKSSTQLLVMSKAALPHAALVIWRPQRADFSTSGPSCLFGSELTAVSFEIYSNWNRMNCCDDLGSLMMRHTPDTLRPERACGGRYSFVICNEVNFPAPPARPVSALSWGDHGRLRFPAPRRTNSGLDRSALLARGKARKPGVKFALAGFHLLVGPCRSVGCPVVCQSISRSSSNEGGKWGGVL
jgi:hypothetical protein